MTGGLAFASFITWVAIVFVANDMREPPTRELWKLLGLAAALNALALLMVLAK